MLLSMKDCEFGLMRLRYLAQDVALNSTVCYLFTFCQAQKHPGLAIDQWLYRIP